MLPHYLGKSKCSTIPRFAVKLTQAQTFNFSKCPRTMPIRCLFTKLNVQRAFNVSVIPVFSCARPPLIKGCVNCALFTLLCQKFSRRCRSSSISRIFESSSGRRAAALQPRSCNQQSSDQDWWAATDAAT